MRVTKIIILAFFAVGSFSLPVSKSTLETTDNAINLYDDSKVVTRRRRSIWTKVFEHISTVVEAFREKPLLVENINNIDEVGKLFKKKLRNVQPETDNTMLSKGANKGVRTNGKEEVNAEVKDVSKQDVKGSGKVEVTTQKDGPSWKSEELDKILFGSEEENTWESKKMRNARATEKVLTIEDVKKAKKIPKLNMTIDEINKLDKRYFREELEKIRLVHCKYDDQEYALVCEMIHDRPAWNTPLRDDIVSDGVNNVHAERYIAKVLNRTPSLAQRVEKDVKEIRKGREKLRKVLVDFFLKLFAKRDKEFSSSFILEMMDIFEPVKDFNEKWLKHKTRIQWKAKLYGGKHIRGNIRLESKKSPFFGF